MMKGPNAQRFILLSLFTVLLAAQTWAQSDSPALRDFQSGLKLVEAEEYEKAATAFLGAVQKDAKFAEGWEMLGVTLFELDLWDAAAPCLLKAIELKPEIAAIQEIRLLLPIIGARPYPSAPSAKGRDEAKLYFELGAGYASRGEAKKTIGAFVGAVKTDPNFADAWIGLGLALYDLGDQAAGLKCIMRGVSMRPELSENPAVQLALAAKDKKSSSHRVY
jgi:tetratricopeptide (TPR) repeat protein